MCHVCAGVLRGGKRLVRAPSPLRLKYRHYQPKDFHTTYKGLRVFNRLSCVLIYSISIPRTGNRYREARARRETSLIASQSRAHATVMRRDDVPRPRLTRHTPTHRGHVCGGCTQSPRNVDIDQLPAKSPKFFTFQSESKLPLVCACVNGPSLTAPRRRAWRVPLPQSDLRGLACMAHMGTTGAQRTRPL